LQIRGSVVAITGAAQGIGAACAALCSEKGAQVSLLDCDAEALRAAAPAGALTVVGDVTCSSARQDFVNRTMARFGRIDVLVNNVGVGQFGLPSVADVEVSKRIFDINVFSMIALTQMVLPEMRRRRSGAIVNFGSVGGDVALPWCVMYSATKWVVHCYTDSLRRELGGSGVLVLKIMPGIVATKFREHALAGAAPARVESIRRVVTPRRVAEELLAGLQRGATKVYVPKIGILFRALDYFAPWAMDRYLRTKF
jgi:short-subunit dehydrogenase